MKKRNSKFPGVLLCCLSVLALCGGCGGGSDAPDADVQPPAQTSTPTPSPTPTPTPVPQVAVLDGITVTWSVEDAEYTAADMTLDEAGRLAHLTKKHETLDFTYDANGSLTKVDITENDDGAVGFQEWTYEDRIPTTSTLRPPEGIATSARDTQIETTLNDVQQVATQTMTTVHTSDGESETRVTRYEYRYDENGRVTSADYYSDKGNLDHTTNVTYDDAGNILSYSNIGAESGQEYLRLDLTYKMVDATTVAPVETDGFTVFNNFVSMLDHIL